MRLSNTQAVSRPTLPDRNPLPKSFGFFTAGVAPHVATVRWTYTVPVNRKFVLGMLQNMQVRDAVATTAGAQQAYNTYTPSGGAATVINGAINFGNAVNNGMSTVSSPQQTLLAGDVISGTTFDNSTAGTATYLTAMAGTEGDV